MDEAVAVGIIPFQVRIEVKIGFTADLQEVDVGHSLSI